VEPGLLDVRVHGVEGVGVVTVRGEIDLANSATLRQVVTDEQRAVAAAGGTVVVVDLAEVTFLDSSGLAVLVAVDRNPEARMRVVVATRAVERVLALTGLDRTLEVHASLDAALAAGS